MQPSTLIFLRKVKAKGRAVFAKAAIKKGTIIERAPVMLVPISELAGGMANPALHKYFFQWSKTHVAMILGYGSLYNHSYRPNARYTHGSLSITYLALRDIAAGEEITINYNFDPKDKTPLKFKVV